MVLFLFVLMLLNLNKDTEPTKSALVKIMGVVAGMCLIVTFVGVFKSMGTADTVEGTQDIGLVSNLGKVLFDEFLLPFELSSVLLLVAMVGAVLLAKKDKEISKV